MRGELERFAREPEQVGGFTLTVNGAIAQKFRGPVGTSSNGDPQSGFIKSYTYDDRLRFRSPPKFIDPVAAGWQVQLYTEQVPAR